MLGKDHSCNKRKQQIMQEKVAKEESKFKTKYQATSSKSETHHPPSPPPAVTPGLEELDEAAAWGMQSAETEWSMRSLQPKFLELLMCNIVWTSPKFCSVSHSKLMHHLPIVGELGTLFYACTNRGRRPHVAGEKREQGVRGGERLLETYM